MPSSKRRKGVQALRTVPTITISSNALNFPNTIAGETSAAQSITVGGTHLTHDITISAAANFIINLDGSVNNHAPLNLGVPGAPVDVFFRFAPTAAVPYDITSTVASVGAVSKGVRLTGNGA